MKAGLPSTWLRPGRPALRYCELTILNRSEGNPKAFKDFNLMPARIVDLLRSPSQGARASGFFAGVSAVRQETSS